MKKIVVFTDFSERAAQAAIYAWHLAHELQANLVLYHAYLNPASQPYAAQIAWPLVNAGQLEINTRKELTLIASMLGKIDPLSQRKDFVPKVDTRCDEGELTDNLESIAQDKDIVLYIMANHRKGFGSLITGNHINKMLEGTTIPVLIVPSGKLYRPLKKIAFATDLNPKDIDVLYALSGFARHFDASIMLANISAESESARSKEKRDQVQQFLCEVSNKLNYPNVYYRHIQENDVAAGLQWATENIAFDLLVMVHRQKNFLERLFGDSHTKSAAERLVLPLLIFPSPATHYPVFF